LPSVVERFTALCPYLNGTTGERLTLNASAHRLLIRSFVVLIYIGTATHLNRVENPMRVILLLIALMGLLLLGSDDVKAQMYGPYSYGPYGDVIQYQPYPYPQQYDPYYDLHVMHYQLYRQQYGYPIYQPCCYGGIPSVWAPPAVIVRQGIIPPRPRPTGKDIRGPRAFKRR
jgi:hypothetical protein